MVEVLMPSLEYFNGCLGSPPNGFMSQAGPGSLLVTNLIED